MRKLFFVINAFLFLSNLTVAQKERTYHWYFGNGAGIDFSSGTAVAVTDGNFFAEEGCAAISDLDGCLLFYTNGDSVMNRNHQRMPNGNDLMGCWSSTQTALIVPWPDNEHLYFIFTVDGWDGSNGLECNDYQNGFRYSVVDMTLEGGLGDVTIKNQLIHAPSTEQLAATMHANCKDVWLMTHDLTQPKFYAYLVSSDGVELNPVVSEIGDPNVPLFNGWYDGAPGYFKFSPNGKKFCAAKEYLDLTNYNTLELYDFDNQSGKLHNIVPLSKMTSLYGASFSPDGEKLYISRPPRFIYQYDLSSDDSLMIVNSMIQIADSDTTLTWFEALQVGIDNKIYVTIWRDILPADTIPVIASPNETGVNCNFLYKGLSLAGKESKEGFPNFIETYFDRNSDCFYALEDNDEVLYVPNIFSPNHDGANDIFFVRGENIKQLKLAVYNRWGQLIFETNDKNAGWDGTFKGKLMQPDVFVYYLSGIYYNGKQINKTGNISIIR